MDLILWRHAQAEPRAPGLPDMERALTEKGERQARRMGRWLRHTLPSGARVIASPAKRALQTAQALGRPLETLDVIGPDAQPHALLRAAAWPHAREAVLVVGHQPTLGEAAAQIMAGEVQHWSIAKGAVWWLRSTDAGVLLLTVRSPEGI